MSQTFKQFLENEEPLQDMYFVLAARKLYGISSAEARLLLQWVVNAVEGEEDLDNLPPALRDKLMREYKSEIEMTFGSDVDTDSLVMCIQRDLKLPGNLHGFDPFK